MKRRDIRQRKQPLAGLKTTAAIDWMLGTLVRVIHSGKQALDTVMLEMGRMVAESVLLMEREEIAGPEYYPTDRHSGNGRMRLARSISATRRSP